MKKTITILLLFTISFFYAQEDIKIDIKKSDIIKEKKKHTNLIFSDSDEKGGIITVKSVLSSFKIKEYKIDHFDANLKLIKSVTLPNEKHTYIVEAFVKDGNIYLIQSHQNKKDKSLVYNVLTSTIDALNFNKKELIVFDRENFKKYFFVGIGPIFFGNGFNQRDGDDLGKINVSKNKNYILLSFDIKNKEKETHLFVVFDASFKKVYQTFFEKNIKDKDFKFDDVEVSDEDGTVYLLGKVFEKKSRKERKKDKKKDKTKYHYELYRLNKEGKKQINIKETDKFVASLHVLHQNNKLTLVGFYSEKGEYRYKGVCRYNLSSSDLKITNKSFQPFSNQFFEDKYKSGAEVSKRKKELRNLTFKSIFIDSNENIVINAEEQYITQSYVSNQYGGYWITTYHFDDIITIKMDKNGKLLWARNINKKQINFANSSFTAIFANNKNYIFINAADKIKKLSNNRISFKFIRAKKSNLYVIRIDENGDLIYKKLIDDKESKVWYNVADGIVNTKEKSVIFQGAKKKYQRILKLQIKE